MMKYVEEGRLKEICVYRLDRISRSLMDFLNMTHFFDENHVGFSSATEPIETNTPYGKAIMSVLMAIAELERKNIQIRVKDNYDARGKKGYFLGGPRPFGFCREKVTAPDGYRTSKYMPKEDEAPVVAEMYDKYAAGSSLAAIVHSLNSRGIRTTRDTAWTSTKISFLLTNPVYVRADADVYQYYKKKEVTIANPAEEFTGKRGCFIFGKKKVGGQKTAWATNQTKDHAKDQARDQTKSYAKDQYGGQILSLGLHEGIIEPDIWLKVQSRLETNQSFGNNGRSKISWISGIIKCGYCGYALTATKSTDRKKTKEYFTFICNGRSQAKICGKSTKVKRVSEIEDIVKRLIFARLEEMDAVHLYYVQQETCHKKLNEIKIKLVAVENEMENMLAFIAKGTTAFSKVVQRRAEELAKEQEELNRQLDEVMASAREQHEEEINCYIENWEESTLEEKKAVAQTLISRVAVTNNEIKIDWKV